MRFHVLGVGSIGVVLAQHLRLANPQVPISLVFRNAAAYSKKQFRRDGVRRPMLKVQRIGGDTVSSDDYDVDVAKPTKTANLLLAAEEEPMDFVHAGGPIDSLIVCTKAQSTIEALEGLQPRLSPSSVIALLQNGMGVYDELCAKFWPDPITRPNFILGTTTHGVRPAGEAGSVIHVSPPGQGAIKWGVVPDPRGQVDYEQWLWGRPVADLPALTPPESPSLPLRTPPAGPGMDHLRATLEALLSTTQLSPSLLPMPHLYNELMLKLAVNAAINPLTAVLGGGYLTNGALHRSTPGHRLVTQLVNETSKILVQYLHHLAAPHPAAPDTVRLFSTESLLHRVTEVIKATKDNISSMAVDIKNGNMTEVDYINGFVVSLANRLRQPAPLNRMMVQMVKFKAEAGGLGDNVLPSTISRLKEGEASAVELRRLALEERKVAVQERALLLHEDRTQEAKRAKREWKRTIRRNQAIARNNRAAEVEAAIRAGADPTAVLGTSGSSSEDAELSSSSSNVSDAASSHTRGRSDDAGPSSPK